MTALPKEPPRRPQLGFLYVPPFRVQGVSIAGEETVIQVPELDVCFDVGRCPRAVLASPYVALTHGHMDHAAGLAYYFSQRYFQGMGTGTVVCPKALERPIHKLMAAWVDLEAQKTPYELIALEPDEEIQIKPKHFLRAIPAIHTVPALGYSIIERRSKLKPELTGMPQEQLIQLKKQGEEITQMVDVPLVCYTGDTAWGEHLQRDDVLNARVLVIECTFLEAGHRNRASAGRHLHLEDVSRLVQRSSAEAVVLVHLSRRTHIAQARRQIQQAIPADHRERVHLLMDAKSNRQRYEQQLRDLGESAGAEEGGDEIAPAD